MMSNDMNSSQSNTPTRFSLQYSTYPASSMRMQGPRFGNYYPPSPYPRPRSSASKPNPSFHGENMNDFSNIDDCGTPPHNSMFRCDQSFNMHHSDAKDMRPRYKDNGYDSPNSEYHTCNESSFAVSPMTPNSVRGSFSGPGFSGRSGQQHSTPRRFCPPNFYFERNGVEQAGTKRPLPEDADHAPSFPHGKSFGDHQLNERPQAGHFGYGNPPVKKQRLTHRCDLCNLDFNSNIPYLMHVAGTKHSKKLKAEEHLKTLKSQGQAIQTDKKNVLHCDLCDVVVNSYLQMQMHLDGAKHKNKCKKLAAPVEEITTTATVEDNTTATNLEANTTTAPVDDNTTAAQEETPKTEGEKESAVAETDKATESPLLKKMSPFHCKVCSLYLNSEIQLQQHKSSKKHQAKVEGKPVPKKKKNKKAVISTSEGTTDTDIAALSTPSSVAMEVETISLIQPTECAESEAPLGSQEPESDVTAVVEMTDIASLPEVEENVSDQGDVLK